jgi:hypothetical protein
MNTQKIASLFTQLAQEFGAGGGQSFAANPATSFDQNTETRWDDLPEQERDEWISKLEACLTRGDEKTREFMGSVNTHYQSKGFLSTKQRDCIQKGWTRLHT